MLVAVMAQRLEQSRAEKYVHVFMLRSRLEQSHREKAADVIKWALMLWTSRLKGRKIPAHVRIYYHSKMLQAKSTKLQLREVAVGIMEIKGGVTEVFRATEQITINQRWFVKRNVDMEQRLNSMELKLDHSLSSLAPLRIPLGSKLVKDDIVRDLVFESTETI
nr:hypothetical protein BaRGS_029287 [Batillaria attramentaria]